MIEAQNVSKTYSRGVYALRDLSLRIDKGDFVFLTGPSGAGKSTFLRLLLFREINARGTTVVVATHDRELIRRVGRRAVTLDHGHIVEVS